MAPVPDWAPEGLALRRGAPVGHVERLAALPDGTGAEYSRTWFDPDRARFVSRFGKGQ